MASTVILDENKIKQAFSIQQYLQGIVNFEDTRLKKEERSINNAMEGEKRIMQMNDSYRKRYNQYVKMIVIVIIAVVVIFGLILLELNFPIIPSILNSVLIALVIAISLSLILYIFYSISIRNRSEFDRLIDGPALIGSGNAIGSGNVIGSGSSVEIVPANQCVNNDCCAIGTKWCESSFNCLSVDNYSTSCSGAARGDNSVLIKSNFGSAGSLTTDVNASNDFAQTLQSYMS